MYTLAMTSAHPAKSGNVYFDFNLQMSPTKVARGICYSPEKRLKLKKLKKRRFLSL